MKKLISFLVNIISYPLAFIFNAKISVTINAFVDYIYSKIVASRLQGAKNLRIYGRPVMITGGKHIFAGDNVEICRLARIDAITYYPNTEQRFEPVLKLANNVVVQVSCHIGCINRVEIGEYTTMGARTYITDHTHGTVEPSDLKLPPRHRKLYSKGPVKIGKYVAIGEGCIILPGVTIGDHSVIGANAVVTRDVPPYSVVAGNPAKVIKQVIE